MVQSDHLNARIAETVIAAISTNVSRAHHATQLLIERSTTEGAASGVLHDSAVLCERLYTIPQGDVRRTIGRLSPALTPQIDGCLKAALGIA